MKKKLYSIWETCLCKECASHNLHKPNRWATWEGNKKIFSGKKDAEALAKKLTSSYWLYEAREYK